MEPLGGKSPITGKKTSFTSLKTMGAKWLGMLCSIPSGLCIGPEGPIIHISALLGYWSQYAVHQIEKKLGWDFDHESEDEKRDFLASGAACGICTAFRAPLAGTLFVVEEAGSFFTTQHLEFTFFSCLIAYWVQWVIGLNIDGDVATSAKFAQTQGYFCNVDNPLNMIAYLIMAVLGGTLGAAFNQVVEHLSHLRAHHINPYGGRRLFEVLFLTILTGSVVVFLPMAASCRLATRDVMLRDSAGCLPAEDFAQVSYGEVDYGYLQSVLEAAETNRSSYDWTTMDTSSSASSGSASGSASSSSSSSSASSSSSGSSSRRFLLSDETKENVKSFTTTATATATATASTTKHPRRLAASEKESDDTVPSQHPYGFGSGSNPAHDLRNVIEKSRVVEEHRGVSHFDTIILDSAADQGKYIHVHYEHTYTCGKASHTFNDMAMLWLNGGVKGTSFVFK